MRPRSSRVAPNSGSRCAIQTKSGLPPVLSIVTVTGPIPSSNVASTLADVERDLAARREHPGRADSGMPSHRHFAFRRENPHASRARRIRRHHECRFAEVHFMRQLLHLARAERGRVGEDGELIAAEGLRREDIDEDERSCSGHLRIVARRSARANQNSARPEGTSGRAQLCAPLRQSPSGPPHCRLFSRGAYLPTMKTQLVVPLPPMFSIANFFAFSTW